MANTFTANSFIDKSTVFGNVRAVMGIATMTDGPTTSFTIGLDQIFEAFLTAKSATTGGFTASFTTGALSILSCASGDTFRVLAFGR